MISCWAFPKYVVRTNSAPRRINKIKNASKPSWFRGISVSTGLGCFSYLCIIMEIVDKDTIVNYI